MNAAPSKYILLCLAILELTTTSFGQGSSEITRCLGTTSGFSVGEDRMDHLNKMIKRYLNCTVVYGNLEITGLESPDIDASFLKDIEVVTGYVLIALNYIPYLPLEKLRIIRGQKLYGPNSYALHIAVNYNREIPVQGLQQLGLKSLSEIQRGNISIIQNNRMCFADTIDWYDILNPKERRRNGWTVTIDNNIDPSLTTCKKCDTACKGGCWGEGPDMCQILTNTICHSVCGDARCRGPGADDCCDSECASGCNGPTDRDCKGCLHVNNNGVCQLNCPPQYIYDQETSRNVPNPDFKYHFNDQCVDKCPSNMLVEENGCVKHCRKGRHNNGSGVCVRCNGNECNKECFGVGSPDGPLSDNDTVDSKNVHHFEGCNIVRGNVVFQAYAFVGDVHTGTPPMKADQIMKAFSGVKVITGYLKILSWPTEFTDFSVFSNLTTIMGVDLFRDAVSFLIQDSITEHGPFHLSHVERLGFRSLKSIKYGNVYIGYMKKMCYQKKVNWTTIIQNPIIHRSFRNGLLLRANEGNCINVSCHAACSSNGCWGPGANECLDCKKLTYKGECRLECDKKLGIYQEGNVCKPCDSECKRTCDGSGPENCTSCAHYVNVAKCVPTCPPWKYPDPVTKKCLLCHKNCMQMKVSGGNTLCSGPNSTLGPGGCEFCNMVVTDSDLKYRECLPIDQVTCPDAHFQSKSSGLVAAIRACVPCVKGCKNCTGSTDKDCLHALLNKPVTIVIIAVVVAITVLGLVGFILFLVYHKRKTSKKKRQMSMRALGLEASPEPMTPSGVAPNQAQLRIVKETELKIGKILGSGAFGTVHKGFWVPDLAPREKVKVPVAIKVLRDESSQVASNEILDEAFVMASCEHPNLVRLLGISLSQRITLITQLMPLGNLLEYVRDNKDNIGSQNILNWCLQIAKGMCYLAEEKHLVHRDLAARNVLVKSPNHVRITDFGLAKLLDVNEDVYRAEGGKMPIKWLALESIQHRIFTQKSDVWSFGVTVWELMTFGKKPYENVPAREVHTLLEKGERLLQPTICTIDVYMLMIKCWTVDADARPTFRELVEEFSKMARDPSRYLVIHNDGQLAELPSPTPTEFFRSLKYEENDDFFIRDAEDYLHTNPEEFAPATPGRGNRFPLQPAPVKAQWRKQQQNSVLSTNSRQHLLGGRIHSSSLSSSTAGDSRHDSAVTMMTGLPSESGAYPPNGCSTPFSVSTPGSAMTPGQLTANGEFAAFARSSGRISRDQMPGTSGLGKMQPSSLCPRTQSESSDVFLSTPSFQNPKDSVWDSVDEHPGLVRAREDSATMRYSDEPILFPRQESRPNGIITGKETLLGGFKEDEEGYLAPTAAAKSKPEYLDPTTFQQSHFVLKPNGTDFFSGTQNMSHCVAASIHPSVMTNPEYEPTFTPFAQEENMFAAGSHNLLCAQRSIPTTDEAGYEIPLGSQTNSLRPPSPQYENVGHSDDFRNNQAGDGSQDDHRILSRSRGSQSGESTSSEKRDSGLQSEGEEEIPLKAKNLKVGGGDTAKSSSQSADANHNYAKQQNPNENSVDNPNYELLENMTDGGFQPMSEFIPSEESNTNPAVQFRLPSQSEYSSVILPNFPGRGASQYGMRSSPPSKDRKNHLKLTINCESSGCDEDPDDDIFVTPESKRRFATNVHDNSRAEDEKGVSRTYSEPDSGVGIEMAMDNILYHRLGSSGWEGSD